MNFVQAFCLCLTIVVLAYPIEFADAATYDDQIFQTKEKPSISSLASLPENVHSFSTEAAGKNNTSFGNSNSTTDDNESESVKALNLRIPGLFASKLLQHAAIQQRQQQLAMNEVAQLSQMSQIHQLLQQQATRIARLRSMLRRCQSRHIERDSFETEHQQQKKKHQMSAAPAPANQKEKKQYKDKDEQQHGATLPRPRHGKQQQQQRLQQRAAAAAAKKKAQMEREKRLRKPQKEEARERSVEEFEKRKSRIRNENYENEQQQQRQWQPLYKSQAKKAHSQHKAPLPAPPLSSSPQNKQPVVVVPRPKPIYTKSRHASHHKSRPPSPPPPPHLPESQSPPLPFPKVVSRKPMANPVSRKKLTRPSPPPVYTPGEPQAKRPQFQERTRFLSLSNNSASSEYYYDDSDYYDESDYVDYGDYDNYDDSTYVDDHQLQSLSAEETTTETTATYVKKEVSTSTSSTADLDETSTRRAGRQSRRRYRSTIAEENEEIIKLAGSYYDKYDDITKPLRRSGSTLFEESLSEQLGARGLVKGQLIILSNFNNNLNLYKNKISLADLCRLIKKKRGYLKREDLVEYGYGGGQKEQSYNKADYKKRGEYSRKLSNGKYYDKYEEKEEPLRFRYLRTEDSVVVIIQNKDGNINQEVKKMLGYKTGLNIKVDNPDIELPIEFLRDEEIEALLEKAIIINNDNNNNNF